jgi:hypothetical protein
MCEDGPQRKEASGFYTLLVRHPTPFSILLFRLSAIGRRLSSASLDRFYRYHSSVPRI